MTLNYRHGESTADDKITAYPIGAKVVSVLSKTYTVGAGHSFRVGDKVLRDPGGDKEFSGTDTVQSVTATTIVMGTTVSGSAGDLLVNLGPDTGTTLPAFDGSKMKIFSDPDGSTAISDATVTVDSSGYEYYHKGDGKFWELIRDSNDAIVGVVTGFGQGNRIHVADYGAAGDGATNDAEPIQAAVLALEALTGTLVAWPSDTYYIVPGTMGNREITIKASNITMDWQGATLTGKHYFIFNGEPDSGTDGDRSDVRSNIHFRNATLGDGGSTDTPIGPMLFWCDDSSVENVLVDGPPFITPVVRVYMSKRCTLRDITLRHGHTTQSIIGFMAWHSQDTLFDNCHLDGKGKTFVFGFQVKGGYDNKIINCSIRDVADTGGSIIAKHGFKDRGDAPWKASTSTGTYPYSGQGNQWGSPDERRASHGTIFMNCLVEGSEFTADFNSQENTDACFVNCVSKGSAGKGFTVLRTKGTVEGEEANIRLLNCVVEDAGNHAFYVAGVEDAQTYYLLPNVLLDGCRAENAGLNGIHFDKTDRCKIVRCTVRNCATAGHATYKDGIWIRNPNTRPEIIGSESFDDQATPTQRYGIYISSDTTYPRVEGCRCTGNSTAQIQKDADGIYLNNSTDTDVIKTFDANDATPSVADGEFFKTANTSDTTITDFLDGTTGQKIIVLINDNHTKIDFTSGGLKGNGGGDWGYNIAGNHMTCWYDGTDWYCDVSVNT